MRLPRMTTRRWLSTIGFIALALWFGLAAIRVRDDFKSRWVYHLWERHGLERDRSVFVTQHAAPYWPRFLAKLLGRTSPGRDICRSCDKIHERYARLVDTSLGPDRSAYRDRSLVASGQLPPYPDMLLRETYDKNEEIRRYGPSYRVIIKADVNGPAGGSPEAGKSLTPVSVPSQTTYVIMVTNSGEETVTGISVAATLSDNLEPVSTTGPTGPSQYDRGERRVRFAPIGRLAPGESIELKVKARATSSGLATCRMAFVLKDQR